MIISAIVAVANNRVIGKDNDIPWYLPADLKYFKKTTLNHHILMGRKCYASIGKPLPKRTNVIVSRDPYFISSNCLVARSIEEGLEMAYDNGEKECFIIGGGTIYNQTQKLWDRLYLTEVDLDVEGDVFFPEINHSEWKIISEEPQEPDEKNPYHYTFKVLHR
ncbi:MAG: dihydrofolate reductase [Saprospiraceae bacterium]|nr:dihydrofolate reductase [Saprospiraceae bacterium]